jgi:hypothetical protein
MNKLVDKTTRIAAIENLTKHFPSQPYSGGNTPSERAMRHQGVTAELASFGDRFDAYDVIWIFYLIKQRALADKQVRCSGADDKS